MNVTWEQILDYARGLASESTRTMVEADPEAMRRVTLMTQVGVAASVEVPENFLNRAKALMPMMPETQPLLSRLIFAGGGAGFRSGPSLAQDLQYEFAFGLVEVRIEPSANGREVTLVGQITSNEAPASQVMAGEITSSCDAFGQFELTVPTGTRMFFVEFVDASELLRVDLP